MRPCTPRNFRGWKLIPLFAGGPSARSRSRKPAWCGTGRPGPGEKGARLSLAINATGAVATGVALAIILVAKFVEGAWVTLLLIPAAVLLWPSEVEGPAQAAGFSKPRLAVLDSPYRRLFRPLWAWIARLQAEQPADRRIAVIIPELIPLRWYGYLLHNHRAEQLKAALLFKGDQRIVVINVPWYTHEVGRDHWQAAPR